MKPIKAAIVFILAFWCATAVLCQQRPDAEILADLQRRIAPTTAVTVAVRDGVVTLTGTVSSLAQKNAVTNLARRTESVRDIVDRVQVVPAVRRTDAEIVDAVRRVLVGNLSREELAAINVRAENGVVILTGTLPSSYPKQVAGVLVSWVAGVVDVRNEIVVRPPVARTDTAILSDIRARYGRSPFVQNQRVFVEVTNGVVTLTGTVDNFLAAEQAEAIARFTPGVVDVRNLLFVRAGGVFAGP